MLFLYRLHCPARQKELFYSQRVRGFWLKMEWNHCIQKNLFKLPMTSNLSPGRSSSTAAANVLLCVSLQPMHISSLTTQFKKRFSCNGVYQARVLWILTFRIHIENFFLSGRVSQCAWRSMWLYTTVSGPTFFLLFLSFLLVTLPLKKSIRTKTEEKERKRKKERKSESIL